MLIETLTTADKLQTQPSSRIKRVLYVYEVGFFSVIKKDGVVLFSGKWMQLEIIRASKASQSQTDKSCFLS